MTTLNLAESQDFDSDKYLLATQVVDLMTKQFNSKELSYVFPYFQIGGAEKQSKTPNDVKNSLETLTNSLTDLANKASGENKDLQQAETKTNNSNSKHGNDNNTKKGLVYAVEKIKSGVDTVGREIKKGFDTAGCAKGSECCARFPYQKTFCNSGSGIRDTPETCDGFTGERVKLGKLELGPAHCVHRDTINNLAKAPKQFFSDIGENIREKGSKESIKSLLEAIKTKSENIVKQAVDNGTIGDPDKINNIDDIKKCVNANNLNQIIIDLPRIGLGQIDENITNNIRDDLCKFSILFNYTKWTKKEAGKVYVQHYGLTYGYLSKIFENEENVRKIVLNILIAIAIKEGFLGSAIDSIIENYKGNPLIITKFILSFNTLMGSNNIQNIDNHGEWLVVLYLFLTKGKESFDKFIKDVYSKTFPVDITDDNVNWYNNYKYPYFNSTLVYTFLKHKTDLSKFSRTEINKLLNKYQKKKLKDIIGYILKELREETETPRTETKPEAEATTGAESQSQPQTVKTETHTNVIQIPYTNMYTKREAPIPPPVEGDDKVTYELRNKAKHPNPFKEIQEGKVPFEYASYKSNKPLKKDEPEIYVENIMEELNYIEYLIKTDKIGERYISQIPMMMRELMKEGNPSKEEIDKIREIIDMSANYKTKKDVDETLQFDFEGLMDNSSIALSEENFMLNSDVADKIESYGFKFLRDFQVKKYLDENLILNENQILLEENEMLKNENAQLKKLNQVSAPPQNILPPPPPAPPAPSIPAPPAPSIPEALNLPLEQEVAKDVLEDNSKDDGYSYDGLVKKDTEPQLKLSSFFKRLEKKYKISVDEQDKQRKLLEVEKMTPEEYKKYEKSIKETLKQNPEYKKIFNTYKINLNKLLELYDDYKFPKYRSLIKELRDKNKDLEFIEDAVLKMIKKNLDDEAERLDSKYKPRYRDERGREEERKAIIRKKKEIKDDMDKENRNPKYVYDYPKKTTTFREDLENAIADLP
jgi:hypothetical protein